MVFLGAENSDLLRSLQLPHLRLFALELAVLYFGPAHWPGGPIALDLFPQSTTKTTTHNLSTDCDIALQRHSAQIQDYTDTVSYTHLTLPTKRIV